VHDNIFNNSTNPDTSNLEYYLKEMVQNTSSPSPSAILVTFRGKTFSFLPGSQNNLLFLDSHLHHPHGALIASVDAASITSLLKWIRHDNFGTTFNLCSFTAIYF